MTRPLRVVWRQTATDDLYRLYDWIADRADPDTAFAYTGAIEAHAGDLATFPERGTPRDDIAPGVRTLNFRGRTVIAYRVGEVVEVLRIFHAGQELGLVE
ncbi:type II toxin-antitoxin system RelE/ParE family toxin [Sphingopyxis kveilinensis]|uniref:type II toxin-antitoxin system RelE/ParE family toxin n=1 Tax=Sphingopyxis kveilinensis TaxID=3114367 RepID=UPI0030CA6D44